MALDIVIGLIVLVFAGAGWRNGFSAQLGRLVTVAVAVVVAKLLAAPIGRFLVTGIDWPQATAVGVTFIALFCVLAMVGSFVLGATIESMRANASDGSGLDTGVGMLLGLATGAVAAYALLCGAQLLTRHLAAKKPAFAIQYQSSKVGRFVLTHNLVDPEPFPHAQVLQALVGAGDRGDGKDPTALAVLLESPKARFLTEDDTVVGMLQSGDWKSLRRDPRLLDLVTDATFLQAADDYMSPHQKVEAEEPTERFKELQSK